MGLKLIAIFLTSWLSLPHGGNKADSEQYLWLYSSDGYRERGIYFAAETDEPETQANVAKDQ